MENGFNIEELLGKLNKLYETEEDMYTEEILNDINLWFMEEWEKEEYLINKFKHKKYFDFKPFEDGK